MTVAIFKPKQYQEYMARLATNYMPTVKRGLLSGAMRTLPTMHRRTREASPANPSGTGKGGAVNTGNYLRAWKARATENGAVVENESPAASIIEYGRRPGKMPPRDAIARWAQRRLGLKEDDAKGIAFVIGRAIKARGLKARNVLSGATEELAKIILQETEREIKKELERTR
jgi:hypothetical protein